MNWLPSNIGPNISGFAQGVKDLPMNETIEYRHRRYTASRLAGYVD